MMAKRQEWINRSHKDLSQASDQKSMSQLQFRVKKVRWFKPITTAKTLCAYRINCLQTQKNKSEAANKVSLIIFVRPSSNLRLYLANTTAVSNQNSFTHTGNHQIPAGHKKSVSMANSKITQLLMKAGSKHHIQQGIQVQAQAAAAIQNSQRL